MANSDVQTYVQGSAFQAAFAELQTLQGGASGQLGIILGNALVCLNALNLMCQPQPTTLSTGPAAAPATPASTPTAATAPPAAAASSTASS